MFVYFTNLCSFVSLYVSMCSQVILILFMNLCFLCMFMYINMDEEGNAYMCSYTHDVFKVQLLYLLIYVHVFL